MDVHKETIGVSIAEGDRQNIVPQERSMNEDRESSANVPKEHQKIYRRWDVTRLPKQRRDLAAMVRRVIQEVLKRVLERTLRAAPDTSCLQLLVGQAVDEVLLIRRRATI